MCYSVEPRYRIYLKDYGFLSFAKNMSSKYKQKLFNSGKKYAIDENKSWFKKSNS